MQRIVLDASIVLKWYLDDEEFGQKAINLLTQYISNEIDIYAPSLLGYELINGLIIAKKRGRIEENIIHEAFDGFLKLNLKLKDNSTYFPKIIHYCKTYNCSAYDASYLSLAVEEGLYLITADKPLYNTVKKDLKFIKWIGEI
ncbi:MAG: type II toxin-antitoxin system VapC family toxin [Candidatus Firestonebacteria bacterium]|nr:type II toxin-antitoxin system VapC family toxin [Candidatus Firestonebacteria bacterium]